MHVNKIQIKDRGSFIEDAPPPAEPEKVAPPAAAPVETPPAAEVTPEAAVLETLVSGKKKSG